LSFNAAKEGCPVAQSVIDTFCHYLAAGIDSLCEVLDPQHVVLAGGITKEGEGLLEPLRQHLRTSVLVTVAQNRGQSGVLGAARLFSPSGGR
jgi:glucokinase